MKYSALGKILGGDQIGECPERKTATGRPPRGSVVSTGPPVRWYSQRHQREGEAHARGPGGDPVRGVWVRLLQTVAHARW